MKGTIGIESLEVHCIVGILPQERVQEQDLIVDIQLELDFSAVSLDNNIASTVDYAELAEDISAWIKDSQFELLEVLVERACERIFLHYPLVEGCSFTVRKPAAIPQANAARVSVYRKRNLEMGEISSLR